MAREQRAGPLLCSALGVHVLSVDAWVVVGGGLGGEPRDCLGVQRSFAVLILHSAVVDRERFGEVGCVWRARHAPLGVRRVLFHPHELVDELVDSERKTAELRVI